VSEEFKTIDRKDLERLQDFLKGIERKKPHSSPHPITIYWTPEELEKIKRWLMEELDITENQIKKALEDLEV